MPTGTLPVIKNYQVVRAIGSGGMSTVYEAIDSKLKRSVAIKVLHAHLYGDPTATERFKREALAAARMDHPNIVRIYDYLYANNTHCIIMEYVHGPDLESVIRDKDPLPFDDARFVMTEVAKALKEAHGQGVLHRDVKPSNVMIQRGNRVMLSDFGLARRIVDGRLTQRDAVAGTPCFMSPEQIGNKDVGFSSDIYSWAVTFYSLFTGRLPYRHQKFPEVVGDIQAGRAVVDKAVRQMVPPKCLALLERCLVAEPSGRIPDGAALCEALDACGPSPTPDLSRYMGTPHHPALHPGSESDISVTQIYRAQNMGPVRTAMLAVAALLAAGGLFWATLWYLDTHGIGSAPSAATAVRPDSGATEVLVPTAHSPVPDTNAQIPSEPVIAPDPEPPPVSPPRRRPRRKTVADSGQLFIYTDPWANVSVDGKHYGRTPLEKPITLPRGTHVIRLYNDFCEPLEDEVRVVSNTVTRKRYTLRVKPAYQ
ncbi:MAG: protein kinase [Chitinivibrionales bacterium]|nr:protein kinase [Chitinivibrionales bacterium]